MNDMELINDISTKRMVVSLSQDQLDKIITGIVQVFNDAKLPEFGCVVKDVDRKKYYANLLKLTGIDSQLTNKTFDYLIANNSSVLYLFGIIIVKATPSFTSYKIHYLPKDIECTISTAMCRAVFG